VFNAKEYHDIDLAIDKRRASFKEPEMAENVKVSEYEESMEVKEAFKGEGKPKNPDVHYLYKMIIDVRLRQRHIDSRMPIESFESMIFDYLRSYEINYQRTHIPNGLNNTVQILCNNPEEREHIKNILLKDYHVLCLENDGKRFFTKFVEEDEKLVYREARKNHLKELEDKGLLDKTHHSEVLKNYDLSGAEEQHEASH
jgi:hypothetical protein